MNRETVLILEKRHIFNFFEDERGENTHFAEKLYAYFRKKAIERMDYCVLNNIPVSGITVNIPENLLNLPTGKQLEPLTVVYQPRDYTREKMMTNRPGDSKGLQISIYEKFFDVNFKPDFFHELKHVIQLSTENFKYNDYYKLVPGISKSEYVTTLMKYIEFVSPLERAAYAEQIYNESFDDFYYYQKDVNEVYNRLEEKYCCGPTEWFVILSEIIKCNDVYKDYIARLFLMNCQELSQRHLDYRLFSRRLYQRQDVISFRKKIEEAADNSSKLPEVLDECTYEIINSKLMFELCQSLAKHLAHYRKEFVKMLRDVVGKAYEDAEYNRKHEIRQIYSEVFYNFVTFSDNKVSMEVIVSEEDEYLDPDKRLIVELTSDNLQDNFKKINILRKYLESYLEVTPGFRQFEDVLDNPKFSVDDLPELPEYDDSWKSILDIVEQINNHK